MTWEVMAWCEMDDLEGDDIGEPCENCGLPTEAAATRPCDEDCDSEFHHHGREEDIVTVSELRHWDGPEVDRETITGLLKEYGA
jgi:hypothetical protein